jgi:hypothetical protein
LPKYIDATPSSAGALADGIEVTSTKEASRTGGPLATHALDAAHPLGSPRRRLELSIDQSPHGR